MSSRILHSYGSRGPVSQGPGSDPLGANWAIARARRVTGTGNIGMIPTGRRPQMEQVVRTWDGRWTLRSFLFFSSVERRETQMDEFGEILGRVRRVGGR